jgi:glycosyltransferase involved in cell wall biosynthesis
MKHVLVVTAYWPPRIDSGTHRWAAMAPLLGDHGWRAVVLTPTVEEGGELDDALAAGVADVETWRVEGDVAAGLVARLRGAETSAVARVDLWPQDAPAGALAWIRRHLVVPDARAPWIVPAVIAGLRRGAHRAFDAVISSGPPVSMHVIAGALAEAWRVPWVADHRDPWLFSSRLAPQPPAVWVQRALRRAVERHADHHLVVTQHAERVFRGAGIGAVTLVRNGFDAAARLVPPERGRVFRIGHVGVLHRDRHRPALWEGLSAALQAGRLPRSAVRVELAGPVDRAAVACWRRCGLDDVVHAHGVVSHREALAIMRRCDVLLVLGSLDAFARQQVPAKIYEAIASGAFVLGAVPTDTEAAALLRAHGHRVVDDDTREAWQTAFELRMVEFMRGQRVATVDQEALAVFDRRSLAARVAACLEVLTS